MLKTDVDKWIKTERLTATTKNDNTTLQRYVMHRSVQSLQLRDASLSKHGSPALRPTILKDCISLQTYT